ncbi:SGNH/GDSL hydrolase family protein [Limosilactobacillus reuteri]|uniref:SGNH/GDSL hydrolase family protein n=1 Tax=Limosilactobacillus reuteri TaxID=1598 RepID=UPI003F25A138
MTKMICLGDSIMQGWDGHKSVATPIPQMIGQINGWQVDNKAIGGTNFLGGDNPFTQMVEKNHFENYDYVLIGYGVNDFSYPSGSIDDEKRAINQGLQAIRAANPLVKILVELPTQDFRNNVISLTAKNGRGWSQDDLCNAIIEVAKENDCAYYDWRPAPLITYLNRTTTLGDSEVHPTLATMQAMAKVLADALSLVARQITLKRLDDTFLFSENVAINATTVLTFIKSLYDQLPPFFRPKTFDAKPAYAYPGDSSDRLRRQYMIKELLSLGLAINQLISVCNKYHVVNPEGFKPTSMISMDPPRGLTFDDVKDGLNREYQKIENKLNEMSEYIANFAS